MIRLARVDPLGPLAAAASLVVFLAHGFDGILSRDLALYSYGAQQAADGVPPYVSVLNRAGPLAHLVPSLGVLGARLVGIDELFGMRLLMLILSVAIVWLVYVYVRDLLSSRPAGLAAAAVLLLAQGFVGYATGGPREKTALLLFLLCALWALLKQRWALAGIFVALATLTWQPVLTAACVTALVSMTALRGRALLGAVTRYAVGGLGTAAVFLIGFALAGALEEFLDGFFLINLQYTYQTGLQEVLDENLEAVQDGYGPGFWVIVVGIAAIVMIALVRLVSEFQRRAPADMAVVAAGAGCLTGLIWSFRAFNGWPDAFILLPFAAAGIGALLEAIRTRMSARTGLALMAAWCVLALGVSLENSIATRDHRLVEQRASVSDVLRVAGPDATVLSVGAPQPLVLDHRTNPVRHQMFLTGLGQYVDDTYPGGLIGLADWIEAEEPTFITADHPTWYAWLRPTLEGEYVLVGEAPDWTWFVHRSVGEDMISELQATTGLETTPGLS